MGRVGTPLARLGPDPGGSLDRVPAAIDQIVESFSASECFNVRPSAALLEEHISRLPADTVVWSCSVLGHLAANEVPGQLDVQDFGITTFVPSELQSDVRSMIKRGRRFIYEEQLLGLARLAIEHGLPPQSEILSLEQQNSFFWALALYGDLHGAEFKNTGNDYDDMAANLMRALAFAHNDIWGNVLARAQVLWNELAPAKEFTDLGCSVNVMAEFEHATGVALVSYLAAVMGLLSHSRSLGPGAQSVPANWAFEPASWFRTSANPERPIAATAWLTADRPAFQARFASMPAEPRFLGLAMLPFRTKPLYRMDDGRVCVVSERFLVEGVVDLVYWTVWQHLKDAHADKHKDFEQFFGALFERYVVDLVASATGSDKTKRVFAEREANPPQGAPDAILFLSSRTVCLEVTKQKLRYVPTLLAADLQNLDEDLDRTAEKAAQLRDAANRVTKGEVRFAANDSPERRALPIDRVVVLLAPIPRWPKLNERLYAALKAHGVEEDAWIIAVNELEEAMDDVHPERLVAALHAWRADPEWWELGFHDFLARKKLLVRGDDRAPLITQANHRLAELIRDELKLKPE